MRYVLVGTGIFSNIYVEAISHLPECELVACVSPSCKPPQTAPQLECKCSLDEIEAPFDAVIIVTPNGLHHEAAIDAARLGKHVLTEKPLDITVEAMDRMMAACSSAGVKLGVAYQRRMNPDNLILKQMLTEQCFGKIYAADLSCKFWREQADYYDLADYRGSWALDGGGPFMMQASHNIDIYRWFFGMPSQITSHLATFAHQIEVEDHGAVLLKYANGMIGTIIASTAAKPGFPARLEVHCEKGTFITTDDCISTWAIDGIPNPACGRNDGIQSNMLRHVDILRDFESAAGNGHAPLIDAQSARETTELILKIYGRL